MNTTDVVIISLLGILAMVLNPLEHNENPENAAFNLAGYFISWVSVFVNPIIYTFTSTLYRKAFFNFFKAQVPETLGGNRRFTANISLIDISDNQVA